MKYIIATLAAAVFFWGAGTYLDNTPKTSLDAPAQQRVQGQTKEAVADEYIVDEADLVEAEPLVAGITVGTITNTEADELQFKREEEKLARDVYQALYDQWGTHLFSNIAASEQTHMDAIKVLLDRYAVSDPAQTQSGRFTNPELQALYDQLVAQGSESALEAFRVGALIEDLDIKDLQDRAATTEKEDIKLVYENLERGSRNHLRAFNRQIVRLTGENYVPVHIGQAEFDEIIAGDVERGPRGGRGRGFMNN